MSNMRRLLHLAYSNTVELPYLIFSLPFDLLVFISSRKTICSRFYGRFYVIIRRLQCFPSHNNNYRWFELHWNLLLTYSINSTKYKLCFSKLSFIKKSGKCMTEIIWKKNTMITVSTHKIHEVTYCADLSAIPRVKILNESPKVNIRVSDCNPKFSAFGTNIAQRLLEEFENG